MINEHQVKTAIKNLLEKESLPDFWSMVISGREEVPHWALYCAPGQDFDKKLQEHGFISPIELWHQYKFPDGFTDESFERYVWKQSYIRTFDSNRIIDPEKYVQQFFAASTDEQKRYVKELSNITGVLSDEEKEYVVNYFQDEKGKVFTRLKKFLPELKALNPEIKDFNPKTAVGLENLYLGMTSRFHPADIEYFCGLTDMKQANKNADKIESLLGFTPGFRIEPHRLQKLIATIKQHNT